MRNANYQAAAGPPGSARPAGVSHFDRYNACPPPANQANCAPFRLQLKGGLFSTFICFFISIT